MPEIHPTAIVDAGAILGDVVIGPYAMIGSDVSLADGVTVGAHTVIEGPTSVGEGTEVGHHVVLGTAPQDLRHDGSATRLEIGRDNVIREFFTATRGSSSGSGVTRIGDRNYFMAYAHVGHDAQIGSHCVFANSAAVAGHAEVSDHVTLGGLSAVHQHNRVGRLAMIGGGAMCTQDVPPFSLVQGDRARLFGLNVTGLRRSGLDAEVIGGLRQAWRTLFAKGLSRRAAIASVPVDLRQFAEVQELIRFVETTTRGVCRAVTP